MSMQGTSNAFDAITVRIYTCMQSCVLSQMQLGFFCEHAHISVVNSSEIFFLIA